MTPLVIYPCVSAWETPEVMPILLLESLETLWDLPYKFQSFERSAMSLPGFSWK